LKRIWHLPLIDFQPFTEIEEPRPVAIITSGPAWESVKDCLHLPVTWHAEVTEATLAHWDLIGAGLQDEVIYAVGGGLVADAAKYLAAKYHLPLVCLPTALSVDAFFTWASGVHQEGIVHYVETRPPDRLLIDLDVIAAAPPGVRAAGICDVLSIATACWDWQFAEEKDMNPPGMAYIPHIAQTAQAILQGAIDCAESAGRGDPAGLKQLLDCLCLEVQLCNQIGHTRPEEGSEHYFAYAAEVLLKAGYALPHGDLLGPGILCIAERQEMDITPLKRALHVCQVPLNRLPQQIVNQTLRMLPEYVRQHDLPFGLAHVLETFGDGLFMEE
jgi:glycerol-1-phosphate dehydrogenase [NAD(P)+]